MILIDYKIRQSSIPNAGKGFFADEDIEPGRALVAPHGIEELASLEQIEGWESDDPRAQSSVRWFENVYTVSLGWPDECYLNHSFEPNGIWHLGFVFSGTRIRKGEEICIDYRFILAPGFELPFHDSVTSRAIVGLEWKESLALSSQLLSQASQEALPKAKAIEEGTARKPQG